MQAQTILRRARLFPTRTLASKIGATLLLSLIGVLLFYPVALLIFTAMKPQGQLVRNPFGPPTSLYFNNIVSVWQTDGLGRYLLNSTIVSLGVVTGTVVLSALGGFGFARLRFGGKPLLLTLVVMGLVMPFETLVIPIFYTMKSLHLLSTYWAIILPQVGLGLPFGILLVRSFTVGLPQELFDAAELDGCNAWQRFWFIALPLIKPALVAVGIFEFIWSWNQYLLPLVVVQDPNLRTVPVMLGFFIGRHSADFGRLTAAAIMVATPTLFFYILFHRQVLGAKLSGAINY